MEEQFTDTGRAAIESSRSVIQYLTDLFATVTQKVEESPRFSSVLHKVEEQTNIPGAYIVSAFTACVIFFLVLTYGLHVLVDVVIVLYPSYKSFKALEDKNPQSISRWMEYWIVFAYYHVVENVLDNIFLSWMPGYKATKFLFLCWCFAPVRYNGAGAIYKGYIEPAFKHNEETADRLIKHCAQFWELRARVKLPPKLRVTPLHLANRND
ncbi:receptor expression-enhancing protein 5-like [Uloborus diversus]|uniref:receptor expression-enhancing protein 5-like n=1 Tax=Uloborus diversus TaxID=327109 RepID=UPI002409695F|nr:receptor expression-enhancing protein 5-like [Uloborus diversus]